MNSGNLRTVVLLVFISGSAELAAHIFAPSDMIMIRIIFQESPVSTSSSRIQFTPEAMSLHYTLSGMHQCDIFVNLFMNENLHN